MLNLLFPLLCNGCSLPLKRGENILCALCRHQLPLACYHRNGDDSLKRVFYGRVPIVAATALMEFQKQGISQRLIHNLKYRRQEKIGSFLGAWLGADLVVHDAFKDTQMVIPVPVHPAKRRLRGYNQVSGFGKVLAIELGKPFREDILLKKGKISTQVFMPRSRRYRKDAGLFLTNKNAVAHKHLLLVDDIITTGATIEHCANILLDAGAAAISVAVMARA